MNDSSSQSDLRLAKLDGARERADIVLDRPPLNRMSAAAPILIAVGAWAIATTPRVVASTPVGIDPFQMMTNARDLPATHYVDYSLIFN
jgi:hypothetical protein